MFNIEGFSIITYKNKKIRYVDYSSAIFNGPDKKQKILELLEFATNEWLSQPPSSVLAVLNITNTGMDMDLLNAFKESSNRTELHQKKVAIIGVTGLLKTAYNFVVGLTKANSKIKAFDDELEAKEWLVSD